jgi:serine/threonine protein kinase/Tol biopolymer transport system component
MRPEHPDDRDKQTPNAANGDEDRRWLEVWRLYSHLRDSSDPERSAALASVPADVREEVLALLEQSHSVTQFSHPEPQITKPEPEYLPGTAIGRYVITGLIGEGGYGRVYSAHDKDLRRSVAIKILSARFTSEDLLAEARSASALNHPNILTIHDTLEVGGHQAMVMEFVEGRSLRRELAEANGPLRLQTAAQYGIQLAQALATAHAAGIAHRDVKPENILVRPDGYLKLVDFGLAAARVESDESGWQPFTGTLRYTSPEQLKGAGGSALSDVFCFGLVLYEMVTGVHPFRRKTPVATATAIATHEPEPPSARNAEIPKPIDHLILRMLSKNAAARPGARQVLDVLKQNPAHSVSAHRTKTAAVLLFGLLVLTGSLAKWGPWTKRMTEPTGLRLKTTPLTGNQGRERRPAISSDGRFVVFEWQETPGDPEKSLVREISSERTFELPVKGPLTWVPGTHRVAYCTRKPGEATLHTISIDGDDSRAILSATGIGSWAFSPDGKYVAYTKPVQSGSALFLYTIGTREHKQLTDPPPPGDLRVAISHEGTQIAVRRGLGDVYISSFPEPGEWRRVVANQADGEAIAWLRGGSGLITSGFLGSNNSLWLHPIDSLSAPTRLTSVGVEAFQANSAADTQRLVWLQAVDDTNVWRMPADGGQAVRVVASLFRDSDVAISSTQVLAFRSDRSGYPEIWVAGSNGENQKRVTSLEGFTGSPRWSADGRFLAFDSRKPNGQGDIWMLDCGSGMSCQTPVRVTEHAAADVLPNWSQDGRHLYFASRRSGSWQLWRTSATDPKATPVQLTTEGGYVGVESADRKWLYYSRLEPPEVAGLWRRPLAGAVPFDSPGELVLPLARSSTATWSLCGQDVFFQTFFDRSLGPQSQTEISAFHLPTGRTRKIRPDGVAQISRGLAVGSDCKSVYFSRLDRSESNVVWADYEIIR